MAGTQVKILKPQPGYQLKALSSAADITIGGGAAGAGKTFCLLMEPLRHINRDGFGGVIFRRTYPMISAEGGLWDASHKIYGLIEGSKAREDDMSWRVGKAKIKFAHLQHEKNKHDWQGSEIAFLGFDELTHFSRSMFFYLLTRNRSTCGVRPYVRATCNPDPDSWVSDFISWWIDPETGYPIPERQGVLRYLVLDNDNYIWGDTPEEVIEKAWHTIGPVVERSGVEARELVKSVTFIGGSVYENAELLQVNPGYLGNLNAQSEELKAQLLDGNWKHKPNKADLYEYNLFRDMFTNKHVKPAALKHITADIALKGSDRFVIYVWAGKVLVDLQVMDYSDGGQVVQALQRMQLLHNVPASRLLFDNDGVGGFVDGFIKGAREFKNGAAPVRKENYTNLKSQCFFRSAEAIERAEYYIPEEVAERMVTKTETLRQRLLSERKAIKRAKPDNDGKLGVIPKAEMKAFLGGESPDFMDAFAMREFFELNPSTGNYYTAGT